MRPPTLTLTPSLRRWPLGRLAALPLVLLAVLAVSWSGTTSAGAQDDYEPDSQVVADVWTYAAETTNGPDHVLRWFRVLHTFDAIDGMTAAEAQDLADTYWAARWDPVVEELTNLETQDGYAPDAQVVADVQGYAAETQNGYGHVHRWFRVLHTFDALDDMTAAEAQDLADTYTAARWDPVVAELTAMEASASEPEPTPTPEPTPEPTNDCTGGEPEGVTALRAEQNIVVSWTTPQAPESCELTGFIVEIAWGEGITSQVSAGPEDTSITVPDLGLPDFRVTVSATYGPESVVMPSTHCSTTVTLATDEAYGVSGTWNTSGAGCDSGGIRIEWKKKARTAWDVSPLFRQTSGKFLWHGLDPVRYEFRVEAADGNGATHKSSKVEVLVRHDPNVAQQTGRPENVRAVADNHLDISVWWDAPEATPTGYTLAGFHVEYWEDGKKSSTLKRMKGNNSLAGIDPDYKDSLYASDARSAHPGSEPSTYRELNAPVPTPGIQNLTEGTTYRVQIVSRYTKSGSADLLVTSPPSNPVTAWLEQSKVWFRDNTPNINLLIGRVFMMVNTNKRNSSAICDINGGTINCPPRTLISLDVYSGGRYRLSSTVTNKGVGGKTAHAINVDSVHGNDAPYHGMIASAGDGKIHLRWTTIGGTSQGTFNATVIQLSKEDATTTSGWQDWEDTVFEFGTKDDPPVPDPSTQVLEHTFTGLENEKRYRVRITGRSVDASPAEKQDPDNPGDMIPNCKPGGIADNAANTCTYLGIYWAQPNGNDIMVTPSASSGVPGHVTGGQVLHAGAGKLYVDWDPPADNGGGDILRYVVRYREAAGGPWTEKLVNPRPTEMDVLRICHAGEACTNPRSLTLTGLTSGTRYVISVSAINANGRGPFTAMSFGAAPD